MFFLIGIFGAVLLCSLATFVWPALIVGLLVTRYYGVKAGITAFILAGSACGWFITTQVGAGPYDAWAILWFGVPAIVAWNFNEWLVSFKRAWAWHVTGRNKPAGKHREVVTG